MNSDLRKKAQQLPGAPGVYLMKDELGELLYIGKARDIRKRVLSYFRAELLSPKIRVLLEKVRQFDVIETPTEVDALLLESQLIRKYKPRYNTIAKDDKSFPFIKITGGAFPMIHITREPRLDRGRAAVRARGSRSGRRKRSAGATYYGPFTDAGLLREAVQIINRIFPLRKCVTLPKEACLYYHIGQCLAPCIKPEVKPEYDRLIHEVKDFIGGGKKTLMEYLNARMKQAAGALAFEEAQFYKEQIQALSNLRKKRFYRSREISGVSLTASAELKKALGLRKIPERIVCFDVSNISGSEAVASRVSFYYEMPDKNEYRRYRIRTVVGIDDYAMIQEAVERMLRGIKVGKEVFLPDLMMIDGGKGHLSAAREVLEKEGFAEVALVAIAKRFEHLFVPAQAGPVILPEDSKALHLVKRIRDEAHRFAITYHRNLRARLMSRSALDAIEGVGEHRKRLLFNYFGSVENIRQASPEEISALRGMNRALALKILAYLRQDPD